MYAFESSPPKARRWAAARNSWLVAPAIRPSASPRSPRSRKLRAAREGIKLGGEKKSYFCKSVGKAGAGQYCKRVQSLGVNSSRAGVPLREVHRAQPKSFALTSTKATAQRLLDRLHTGLFSGIAHRDPSGCNSAKSRSSNKLYGRLLLYPNGSCKSSSRANPTYLLGA